MKSVKLGIGVASAFVVTALAGTAEAQLRDITQISPTVPGGAINKSYSQEIGVGRGDIFTADSSLFIINRDPFRAIRRGRQLFQRKFTVVTGVGPIMGDGSGHIDVDRAIGAGLADSCASCHGRPRGAAGFGGDVVTRPDSRDAAHLFGLGLKEMLADEMTADLRKTRDAAVAMARQAGRTIRLPLAAKGVRFGYISAFADGRVDVSEVEGIDPDLRIRPFFAHGGTISIREFVVGALNGEMGLRVADPDLAAGDAGLRVITPAGMVLDGSRDNIEGPPSGVGELEPALVDYLEFYLLNYFKAGRGEVTADVQSGQRQIETIGCTSCHVPDLTIARDRRVADVDTAFDPARGHFNRLFATARGLFTMVSDAATLPPLKQPLGGRFQVRNIYT